eukprot:494497-Hanusia_phi.AAC.1
MVFIAKVLLPGGRCLYNLKQYLSYLTEVSLQGCDCAAMKRFKLAREDGGMLQQSLTVCPAAACSG